MANYKLIVMSEPVEGREDEYNVWYESVHMPQVLAVEGFTSAQRYRLAENLSERDAMPYAAIYNIETDNLQALLEGMNSLMGTEDLVLSDAINTESASVLIYEELGGEMKP